MYRRFAEEAGVQVLRSHPYCLRHGGASRDSLHRLRTMEQIKKQGRWKCDSSVGRYNKHARVVAEANKLPRRVRMYGNRINKHLVSFMFNPRKVPGPPNLNSLGRQ